MLSRALVLSLLVACAPACAQRLARSVAAPPPPALEQPDLPPDVRAKLAGPVYMVATQIRTVDDGRPTTLTAPKVAIRPGQRATVSVVNQLSYVQDFDAEISGDAYIADPVVGIVQDGVTLELLVTPVPGAPEQAWVAFDAAVSDLQEPIRTKRVRFTTAGADGVVQLPKIAIAQVAGVRKVTLGTQVRLLDLPAPGGIGRLELHARLAAFGDMTRPLSPEEQGALAPPRIVPHGGAGEPDGAGEDDADDMKDVTNLGLAPPEPDLRALVASVEAGRHAEGRLSLDFVRVRADLTPKRLLTENAARALTEGAKTTSVHRMVLDSSLVAGVHIASLDQLAYVQDYDLPEPLASLAQAQKPLPGTGPLVYHPIIGTLRSGRSATIDHVDGARRLRITCARPGPMPDFEARLERGPTVTIELPELRIVTAEVDLAPGRWLLPLAHAPDGGVDAVWIDYRMEP